MDSPKARLPKGTPETQARMKELSEKAKAARAPKPVPPVSMAPDFNEFNQNMGATFTDRGTFFNPATVYDPRISMGAPFPPDSK